MSAGTTEQRPQGRRLRIRIPLPELLPWKGALPPSAAFMGVWFAVALHTLWACLLLASDGPKHATALAELAAIFPAKSGLAIVLLVVAACAMYGIVNPDHSVRARVLLLTPQQFTLGVSAYGAIHAMWVGHFADGVSRPTTFLIADQSPAVLALLIHAATILYLALTPRWRRTSSS